MVMAFKLLQASRSPRELVNFAGPYFDSLTISDSVECEWSQDLYCELCPGDANAAILRTVLWRSPEL